MKRLFISIVAFALIGTYSAMAWGGLGHRTVVEIAKRHLTEKTKENIAKYLPHDLTKDATWMDKYRLRSPWPYSNSWHSYYYDAKLRHDPNNPGKIANGDTMRALDLAERNLSIYKELSDSAVVYNIRMVLHFVGDMHCPSHCKFTGGRDDNGKVTLNGKKMGSFHGFYDKMPSTIYGKITPAKLAEKLDTYSKGKVKRTCKGDHHEWAEECMRLTNVIHQWNPNNGNEALRDDTIELSKELIDTQLRHAGYRLAHLLNKYFGK